MNNVSLTGRLTRDPEMRSTADGTDVCAMRLAVDGPGDNPTYIDVTAFGDLAANCGEYLAKGRPIAASGRLSYGEWETKEGDKRSKHEVIARQIDFLSGGQGSRDSDQDPVGAADGEAF